MSRDVDRFSRWAPTYDRHFLRRFVFDPVQRTVLELATAEVPNPHAALDVGCGTGRLLRMAAERYPNAGLVGVDAAVGMIAQAKAVTPLDRIQFEVATAENLPFPDETFDLVFSTMTFHHWSEQKKGIAEIARVLKPGGRWVLADPIVAGVIFRSLRRLLKMNHFLARAELESLLESARLGVVAERRVRSRISVLAIARRL